MTNDVIRTETIEGRTYALVESGTFACDGCAMFRRDGASMCGAAKCVVSVNYRTTPCIRIELPHHDRGE
jgi:hypothetical protein